VSTAADSLTTREDRARARARRNRRAVAISTASTVIVLGGLAVLVLTSPGWPSVKRTFFSAYYFKLSFPSVLKGFWLDVQMFVIVEIVVLIMGLLIALIRTVDLPVLFPVRLLSKVFVDVMRGVPLIILIYLIGFGVPALRLGGLPTDPRVLAGITLAMSYSAYVSEVYRAGILSVHPSQGAAGLALGLTRTQTLRHVILPQAVRRVIPPLLNDFISLQKDVALVAFIGPQEAFQVANVYADQYFNYTPLISAALLYLCVTIPLVTIFDRMQMRTIRQRGTALAFGPR
jgi:polar amino acid transport system permease protein